MAPEAGFFSKDCWLTRLRCHGSRFIAVSLGSTVFTQLLVWWFVGRLGWSGGRSNFAAVVISSFPAYLATRHWVWQCKRGGHSLRYEVLPFWGMNLIGLALSTVLAWLMFHYYPHPWAVSLANIAGFASLWLVRFHVLDKFLFNRLSGVRLEREHVASVTRSAAVHHPSSP